MPWVASITSFASVRPTISPITQNGLQLNVTASDDYQWTVDGNDIQGETNSSTIAAPPYGTYSCYTTNSFGCISYSDSVTITASLEENSGVNINLYPNPVDKSFSIQTETHIESVDLIDMQGKVAELFSDSSGNYDVSRFKSGQYIVRVFTDSGTFNIKISKR